jgi:hypothetical protein
LYIAKPLAISEEDTDWSGSLSALKFSIKQQSKKLHEEIKYATNNTAKENSIMN